MKIIDAGKAAFIRDNWFKLSSREIASAVGVAQPTVMRYGVKTLGLGRKPRIDKPREQKAKRLPTGETSHGQTFPDMTRTLFRQLTERRATLLAELDALTKLPKDDDGKLAVRLQRAESELAKVEHLVIDYEDVIDDIERLDGTPRHSTATLPIEFDTLEQLLDFLTLDEQRKSEGRMMAKVKAAAELVKQDWQGLTAYDNGEVDCVLTCPEAMTDESAT